MPPPPPHCPPRSVIVYFSIGFINDGAKFFWYFLFMILSNVTLLSFGEQAGRGRAGRVGQRWCGSTRHARRRPGRPAAACRPPAVLAGVHVLALTFVLSTPTRNPNVCCQVR